MNEGVKKLPSLLKVGKVLELDGLASSFSHSGEKSAWRVTVELELDFFRRKILSRQSLANSASPLLLQLLI